MSKKQVQKKAAPQVPATIPTMESRIEITTGSGLTHATTLKRLMSGVGTLNLEPLLSGRSVWGPEGKFNTKDVQAMILEAVGQGLGAPAALMALEKSHGGTWPSPATLYSWRRKWPEFGRAFKDAQGARGEILAEAALEVAMGTDPMNAAADTLRVKTLQAMAGKIAPNEFGEKSTVEVQHSIKNLTDDEVERRLKELSQDPDLRGLIHEAEILEK